jgi:phosphohistidine swiveling domain-containing protein
LGLPALVGVEGNLEALVEGAYVVLDANAGQLSEWKK